MATCRESKIGQLDVGIVLFAHEQKILGFHVAMGNLGGVAVSHRLEHLDNEIAGIGLGIRLLFTDSVEQITPTHEFHDEKVAILLVKKVDQGDNMRMVQGGKNGDFIVNGGIVWWWQVLAQDTLDGNLFPCCSVCPTTNGGKGPGLELRKWMNGMNGEFVRDA